MQNGHLIEAGALKHNALLKNLISGRGFGSVLHHQVIEPQPVSGWDYFCLKRQYRHRFPAWPRERWVCLRPRFCPLPPLCSRFFSTRLASVREGKARFYAGFELKGCGWSLHGWGDRSRQTPSLVRRESIPATRSDLPLVDSAIVAYTPSRVKVKVKEVYALESG